MSIFFRGSGGTALAKKVLALALVTLLSGLAANAQSSSESSGSAGASADSSYTGPQKGGREIEFWTGGGPSIAGGIRRIGVWNGGFRYGFLITDLHGPGFLRGRFESAVDVTPLFLVFQPGGAAYGVGIVPAVLKWDFEQRGRLVPYFDLDGNTLFTDRRTPPNISRINFTPSAAFGAHWLLHEYAVTAEFRFLHISDAGLTNPNPGINTVEIRIGVGMFTRPKHH
jgi:hypothetical protein